MTAPSLKIDIEGGEALVMPAAVALLKEQRPHVYLSLHAPLMEEPRPAIEEIIKSLDTYPFLYSNQGKLITAEILLRDTNLQRFFEIIATDLTPAEVGEKLAGRQAFKRSLRHNKKSLSDFFGKHTDGAKMNWNKTQPMSGGLPFNRRLNRSPYLQEPNPELQQKLIGQLQGIVA